MGWDPRPWATEAEAVASVSSANSLRGQRRSSLPGLVVAMQPKAEAPGRGPQRWGPARRCCLLLPAGAAAVGPRWVSLRGEAAEGGGRRPRFAEAGAGAGGGELRPSPRGAVVQSSCRCWSRGTSRAPGERPSGGSGGRGASGPVAGRGRHGWGPSAVARGGGVPRARPSRVGVSGCGPQRRSPARATEGRTPRCAALRCGRRVAAVAGRPSRAAEALLLHVVAFGDGPVPRGALAMSERGRPVASGGSPLDTVWWPPAHMCADARDGGSRVLRRRRRSGFLAGSA